MKRYSHFFSTLYDEQAPVGCLGRGTHYSVCRAVLWEPDPGFHDFAIIWDEDHDERVVWVVEQMLVSRLLQSAVAVGERKGSVTVLTRGPVSRNYVQEVVRIAESVPSDCFSATVEPFEEASGMIINDETERVRSYLAGIDALWRLGSKPCQFMTSPFGAE